MRTEAVLETIVTELQNNCGDMFKAAKAAGVSLMFVQQWCKDDKDVQVRLHEAKSVGAMRIESAAIERAVDGVDKAVYFKGEVVGFEKVYSDGLLGKLLEARVPGFEKGDKGININGGGPVQINIMPRANSYDEWLSMKERALNPPQEALPAPEQPIDAEFTPVPANPFEGIDL
jgi:hypothetical protein